MADDRVVWESPTEMLEDIWAARKERDTLRAKLEYVEAALADARADLRRIEMKHLRDSRRNHR